MHTRRYYLLLLCLVALTVVLFVRIVGIVLVVALLNLPAAAAGRFAKNVLQLMALSALLCMASTTTGLAASYILDWPSGPTIIMVGGVAYVASRQRGRGRR